MYVKAEIGKMWVSYHEMQLYTLSRSLFSVCDIVISRSFFFLKSEGDIVIASVSHLCYLLSHGKKSNKFVCVCFSHEWGVQQHNFFGPHLANKYP